MSDIIEMFFFFLKKKKTLKSQVLNPRAKNIKSFQDVIYRNYLLGSLPFLTAGYSLKE